MKASVTSIDAYSWFSVDAQMHETEAKCVGVKPSECCVTHPLPPIQSSYLASAGLTDISGVCATCDTRATISECSHRYLASVGAPSLRLSQLRLLQAPLASSDMAVYGPEQ